MNIQKIALAVLVAGLVGAGAWYFISSDKSPDTESVDRENVIAVVNGEEISREDFENLRSQMAAFQGFDISSLDEETKNQLKAQVVNELIAQKLIKQKAGELGITASQEEVSEQVENTIAQLGGEEAYRESLAEEGFSEGDLRELISINLTIQNYFKEKLDLSSITATEEEIEAFYEEEAARNENLPALEEVRSQIEGMIIQQKQQELKSKLVQELREEADVELLIE